MEDAVQHTSELVADAMVRADANPQLLIDTMTNSSTPSGCPPFTPWAKKVLELSLREALQLGHS